MKKTYILKYIASFLLFFVLGFNAKLQAQIPTTGLGIWYKADAGVIGNPVSQWQDQSGNNRHATQVTVSNQPDFVSSEPLAGGAAVLSFNSASQQHMDFDGSFMANTNYTVFVVAARNVSDAGWLIGGSTNANNSMFGLPYGDNTLTLHQ